MDCRDVRFSGHALSRMFERGLAVEEVLGVLAQGESVMEYPDDTPYPSRLLLGQGRKGPLHVVVAIAPDQTCVVITAYVPNAVLWTNDFRKRREE